MVYPNLKDAGRYAAVFKEELLVSKPLNRVGREFNEFNIISGEPEIGEGTWVGYFVLLDGTGGLKIGKHCSISSGVHIYSHDSVRWAILGLEKDTVKRSHLDFESVEIGDYCFIGANSVILRGTKIGHHSVVAASSLVQGVFPPYSLIAGNPARRVKDIRDTPRFKILRRSSGNRRVKRK